MTLISEHADIEIDRQRVVHTIGYGTQHKPSARVESLIDKHIEAAYQFIEPSYSYAVKNIDDVRRSCVFVEDSIVFESRVIAQLLKQCERVAVFLVTIGNGLEEKVCQLAEEGLVLEASVLDAIGSSAAENVAEFVQDRVVEMAHAQNLCTSRRFSPGYCDWALRQQKMVFKAINDNSTGVRLTKECLMIPRKSISGIIGIGPTDMKNYNPCNTCKKRNCLGRRDDTTP